ncbi:NAD-dependent epimerase/dehydratase family protein [Cellulomonas wangsupingiae]|uniref:NAD(P)-dependent oxidoreductase n=1 Tax=Cellulomonas wangsupingiae TaxID=2968085 RepID=A0ABY5K0F3_9CELL|nr:NAD(P)-dependent oxidoreductase [Cellulomonas wangsupingiae]MCC2335681.1 NAD(P)-dependent oxidoreductase [Cellulomonas wangsupingiae]UUI63916.1 NAD(P)-dependent oxidoreductase [Cellulomonas wangsupingiae]
MNAQRVDGPPALVVGGGGLLGRAVLARAARTGWDVDRCAVPWHDPAEVAPVVADAVDAVRARAGSGPWYLVWCAGAGVTSSQGDALGREVATIESVVDALLDRAGPGGLTQARVFLASSAGGVYAGSSGPPFTERTVPVPLAAYGRAKLATEQVVARLATQGGARVLTGRLSNLYGPGQNLAKPQGLVSQLCRSQLTGRPVGVYVSLDTLRDYLFVDDAAALVVDGLERLPEVVAPGQVLTKILASQRADSIASLVGEVRRLSRRHARILVAPSPASSGQVRDLRLRSVVWPELDRRPVTPLVVGVHATMRDLAAGLGAGAVARAGGAQAPPPVPQPRAVPTAPVVVPAAVPATR